MICLDFNLAAQADTLDEAQKKLHQMIKSYIADVLSEDGPDRAHAKHLLRRRAPLVFWIKYYVFSVLSRIRGKNGNEGNRIAISDPLPMIPAGA